MLDLGGDVYALSGPSDRGGCLVCLIVGIEVMVFFFFMLFTAVVLREASDFDSRRPTPGEHGRSCGSDEAMSSFCPLGRLSDSTNSSLLVQAPSPSQQCSLLHHREVSGRLV